LIVLLFISRGTLSVVGHVVKSCCEEYIVHIV